MRLTRLPIWLLFGVAVAAGVGLAKESKKVQAEAIFEKARALTDIRAEGQPPF